MLLFIFAQRSAGFRPLLIAYAAEYFSALQFEPSRGLFALQHFEFRERRYVDFASEAFIGCGSVEINH